MAKILILGLLVGTANGTELFLAQLHSKNFRI